MAECISQSAEAMNHIAFDVMWQQAVGREGNNVGPIRYDRARGMILEGSNARGLLRLARGVFELCLVRALICPKDKTK